VQRVLDIDLDFFGLEVVHWPSSDERPDPEEHSVWSTDDALMFLTDQCGLTGRLPCSEPRLNTDAVSTMLGLHPTEFRRRPTHASHRPIDSKGCKLLRRLWPSTDRRPSNRMRPM
jgi:hypothetical protein